MRQFLMLVVSLFLYSITSGYADSVNYYTKQCNNTSILCVDVNAGHTQEYKTIQAAALDVKAGQTILVFDGDYAGFQFGRDHRGHDINGTKDKRILIKAVSNSAIIKSAYLTPTMDVEKRASRACGISINFGGDYLTIDGLHIDMIRPRNPDDQAAMDYHGPGICNDGHDPVENPLTSLELLNLTINEAGDDGVICGHCDYVNWSGNIIKNTYRIGSKGGHGLYLANGRSDYGRITNNKIYNNDGNAIHLNGDASRHSDGIITNPIIKSNTIFNNGFEYKDSNGGVGINMDGVQNAVISNNLIFNNFGSSIQAYKVDGAEGPKNITIVSNTILSDKWAIHFIKKHEGDDMGGHIIFNNILLGAPSKYGSISVSILNFKSDYNILVNGFSDSGSYRRNIGYKKWLQNIKQDIHSLKNIEIESIFMDVGSNDFRLKEKSPAINHGANQFSGVKVSGVDIGAFKYKN